MIRALILCLTLMVTPLMAVDPGEVLDDPVLEKRARSLSQGLRCLQCRNESIDESNAGIARDLRILVRERLLAGDSDTEVIDHVVTRYGEYVLLRPNSVGSNLVLWLAGPILLLITLGGLALVARRKPQCEAGLSQAEEEELKRLLDNESPH